MLCAGACEDKIPVFMGHLGWDSPTLSAGTVGTVGVGGLLLLPSRLTCWARCAGIWCGTDKEPERTVTIKVTL